MLPCPRPPPNPHRGCLSVRRMLIKNVIHSTFPALPFIPPTESASSLNKVSGLLSSILFFPHIIIFARNTVSLTWPANSTWSLQFVKENFLFWFLRFSVSLYASTLLAFHLNTFAHNYILFVFLFTPLRLSFPSRKSLGLLIVLFLPSSTMTEILLQ